MIARMVAEDADTDVFATVTTRAAHLQPVDNFKDEIFHTTEKGED